MRWLQTVGMVRWCRIHPDLKENLSGGVGFVRWCRIGLWDFPWDFLNGNRVGVHVGGPQRRTDLHNLMAAISVGPRTQRSMRLA
jgi:hypothetical protein